MNRIVELGKQIWSLPTEDERERYYMVGTLTFVEDIAALVGNDIDFDNTVSIDELHDQIIY